MNKLIYKTWTFEDDRVKSGSCYLETSLPASSLGINTLEVVVKCADAAIADFAQNDPVTYYYKGHQRGIYYIQSVERIGPDRYTLTAVSALGLLAQKRHPGGIYTGQTVQEVVTDICGDIPVIIKSNLANIALYGWLPYVAPPKASAKDNLSQVLFAIGAAITNDLDGVLRIEPLWSGVSGFLDDDHVCRGGKVTTEPAVTAVSVTEHQYFQGGETKELFEGSTQSGDIITFNEPAYDLTAEGFTILESGANYAKVSSGTGKLTGKTYIHNTRQVTVEVTPGPVENIKTPTGNPTLVSLVNSYAVAQRLAAYYKCRETIEAPAMIGAEHPGAVVSMYHPYGKKMVTACLETLDAHMSAVLKADLKALVGYEPPDIAQQEYYDTREVLTVSGSITVPAGVTHMRAVLIGGAYGGAPGNPGETGGIGEKFTYTNSVSGKRTYWRTLGRGGKGGSGGNGGQAGKVLVVDIDVTPGDVIPSAIGTGGPADAPGTATTFGSYSSEDGSVLPDGYVDPVTGDVYATAGDVGLPGGDGNGWAGGDLNRSNALNIAQGAPVGGYGPGENSLETASEPGYYVYYYIMSGGGARNKNGSINGGSISTKLSECKGGKGANATLVPGRPSVPGKGGTGGSGGGGGGGAAAQEMRSSTDATAQGGDGGLGSIGGPGANGAVILYYAKPKIIPSGQLMGKNRRFVLDRTGRLMVV